MLTVTANNRTHEADLIVFDKDGLMFDSEQFWIEMANARVRSIFKHCSVEDIFAWAKLMNVQIKLGEDGQPEVTWVDPVGILAVAPPPEEIIILAAFLVSRLNILWHQGRSLAAEIFEESDKGIDLKRGLKPQPGYIELMKRINDLDLPYGVATSDTLERTRDSMAMYGFWKKVRFVVTPTDVKFAKPYPDMLEYVSQKTGVPLNRIVMIGDSYVDVKMAQAAGSIGIGVTPFADMREKMQPYATEIVETLNDIRVDKF